VVICSPVFEEARTNYRREVLLSLALARQGIAAQRFQYRGTGNSEGDPFALTYESMCEDAGAAAERLIEKTGVRSVAFMGTRLGAMVAARVAAQFGRAPVVLWDPILESGSYFKEMFRARIMSDLKRRARAGDTTQSFADELRDRGWVEIFGYSIGRALHDSLEGHRLEAELGMDPRPVFLVRLTPRKEVERAYAELQSRLEGRGFPVASAAFPNDAPWWFNRERVDLSVRGAWPLFNDTVGWLAKGLVP
jgi:pimeloyl-ACP methyl ester carboxylesterase